MEHWECLVCSALTSDDLDAWWRCSWLKGVQPAPAVKATARDRIGQRGLGKFHTVVLVVLCAILVLYGLGYVLILDAVRWAK